MAIETAGCGGPTRKEPPERDTAAGRATAGRVVPIAIPSRKRIQRLPAQLALLRETKTIPLKDCPLGPDWERTKFGFSKRRDNTHYGYLIALK